MHDAFQLFPVLEQLPVQVESLAAIGDRLLIGTSRGQLLVYKVQNRTNDGVSIRLVDTKKSFAKQAIKQLEVIKEAGLLIALADDVVSLFDLQTYSPSMKLSNTKGAQLMITHTEIDHIKEIPVLVSKLCVVTRKKIIVFEWRDAQYHEYKEYPFSERIRSVQFATPNLLLIATSREFTSLHLPLGQWIDLFSADAASLRTAAKSRGGLGGTLAPPIKEMPASSPTSGGGNSGGGWGSWTRGFIGGGGSAAPMVVRMPNEELLLCREDIGVFITHAGKLSRNHNGPVSFPSVPINITYYSPLYLITTEKRATEDRTGSYWVVVRSVVDHSLIQELELGPEQSPCAAINGVNGKQVWIASASTVWYLLPVDIHKQVEQVLRGQDFEQAHNLIAQADNILEEERTQLIQKVQWLHARWLFSEEAEYERALDIFSELNATPTEAIALCPKSISGELAEDDGKNKEDSREQGEGKLVAPQERGEDVEATREEVGEKEEGADKAGGVASPLSGADTVVGFSDQVSTNLSSRKQVKERRRVVWRDALLHMMRYLTEHRRRIQKAVAEGRRELDYLVRIIDDDNTAAVEEGKAASRRQPKSSSNESISNAQSKETSPLFRFQLLSININTMAMAQVVDTTLLKLYIECSPSLIGSLLRVKNYCDIEESEKLLLLHKKYKELVDLYHGKGLHRKALQLLVEHSGDKDNREMYGTRPLIDYLQRLPASQFDLVLEYAGKTLQPRQPARADDSDDDDAGGESNSLPNYEQAIYLVFADGRPASLSFPRNKVATFLTQISPLYAACYLEHVIWEWSDTDASLHDIMALSLLQIVLGGGTDRAGIEQSAPAPDDEARLVEFLKASTHYTPEKVLLNLPPDRLFRERMYVLARLRQYQKALQLGVFCMRDLEFAEQFCKEHVDEFGGIYLMLLNILTSDPPSDLAEARLAGSEPLDVPGQRQSRLDFALHLIATYPSRFPIAETIQALPASTPLHKNFLAYFRSQLRVQDQHQRSTCILSNLGIAEQFQLRRHLKELQSTRVVITETSTCSHCLKRIGRNVAFAVLPGKSRPIHLSCWQRRKGAERKAAVTMAVAAGGHLDGGHTAGSSSS